MPELDAVRKRPGGWNLFGKKIASQMEQDGWGKPNAPAPLWDRAKFTVHEAITGNQPEHSYIRNRVLASKSISAMLHSDLSLWLAGKLSISIAVTKRLVALMLVGVAEAKGDWNVLDESDDHNQS